MDDSLGQGQFGKRTEIAIVNVKTSAEDLRKLYTDEVAYEGAALWVINAIGSARVS